MSYLSVNQVQSYKYSPENKYAQEYLNVYRDLVDLRYKLNNSEHRSGTEIEILQKKFDELDKKIPKIAMKANKEEQKLDSQNGNEQNGVLGQKLNYLA